MRTGHTAHQMAVCSFLSKPMSYDQCVIRMKKQILLGTTNQAKINHFRAYLAALPIEILSPGDLGIATDVEEDGKTPEENAEIK